MNWSELLRSEIESTYRATQGLLDLVDEEKLDWKPSEGSDWMTTGQLLMHLTISCGAPMCGYVTGDWGLPEGVDMNDLSQLREAIGLSEDEARKQLINSINELDLAPLSHSRRVGMPTEHLQRPPQTVPVSFVLAKPSPESIQAVVVEEIEAYSAPPSQRQLLSLRFGLGQR